jgi:hypothetical protein
MRYYVKKSKEVCRLEVPYEVEYNNCYKIVIKMIQEEFIGAQRQFRFCWVNISK